MPNFLRTLRFTENGMHNTISFIVESILLFNRLIRTFWHTICFKSIDSQKFSTIYCSCRTTSYIDSTIGIQHGFLFVYLNRPVMNSPYFTE